MKTITAPWPHSDAFEKLIGDGKMEFHEHDGKDLHPWVQACIGSYLDGVPWRLGSIGLREEKTGLVSVCLKVEHGLISYLDVFPCTVQSMLVTDEAHHESMHPDEFLMRTILAENGKLNPTGRLVQNGNGSTISVDFGNGGSLTIEDRRGGAE